MANSIEHTLTAISEHQDRVTLVSEHSGIPTPKPYTVTSSRWHEWRTGATPSPLDALTRAYADGAPLDTLTTLRAAAVAAHGSTPVAHAEVLNAPAEHVLDALYAAWEPVKVKAHAGVVKAFNAAAADLERAADTVDIHADAATMVQADEAQRVAWVNAEIAAARLTTLEPVLHAAAALAGHRLVTDGARFGAVADVDDVHIRDAWAAWESTGNRTGKWGALLKAGAIVAARALDDLEPIRAAKPLETIQVSSGVGIRSVTVDPESPTYEQDLAQPGRVKILGV